MGGKSDVTITWGADATQIEAMGQRIGEVGDVSERRLARGFERATREIMAAQSPMEATLAAARSLGHVLNVGLPIAAAAGIMWQFYEATKKSYEEMSKLGEETLKLTRPIAGGSNFGTAVGYGSQLDSLRDRMESVTRRRREAEEAYFDPDSDRGKGKVSTWQAFLGVMQSGFTGGESGMFGNIAKAARAEAAAEESNLASAARLLITRMSAAMQSEAEIMGAKTRSLLTGIPDDAADGQALRRKQQFEADKLNEQLKSSGMLGTDAGKEAVESLRHLQDNEREQLYTKQFLAETNRGAALRSLDDQLADTMDAGGAASERKLRALQRKIDAERREEEMQDMLGTSTEQTAAAHRNAIASAERERTETARELAEQRRRVEDQYADATDRGGGSTERGIRATLRKIEAARREEEMERSRGADMDPDKIRRLQVEQERGKSELYDQWQRATMVPTRGDSLTAVGGGGGVASQSTPEQLLQEATRQTSLQEKANEIAERIYKTLSTQKGTANSGFSAE